MPLQLAAAVVFPVKFLHLGDVVFKLKKILAFQALSTLSGRKLCFKGSLNKTIAFMASLMRSCLNVTPPSSPHPPPQLPPPPPPNHSTQPTYFPPRSSSSPPLFVGIIAICLNCFYLIVQTLAINYGRWTTIQDKRGSCERQTKGRV